MESQNAEELLKLSGNPLFLSLLDSISCVVTIVESDNVGQILRLIEMVYELPVTEKYLLLIAQTFDSTALQNLTINFQVIVHHAETGKHITMFLY